MKRALLSMAVGSAITFAGGAALAAPFNSFDPRSMGMGGAGVAVGNTATAPFFNPALLAVTPEGDNFALELPIVGGRVYDPKNFEQSVDDFQNNPAIFDANTNFIIDQHIAAFNASPSSAGLTQLATDTRALSAGFSSVSDKNIQLELGAASVLGIPNKSLGVALMVDSWNTYGGVVRYRDGQTLTQLADTLDQYANCYQAGTCGTTTLDPQYVDSSGNITFNTNQLNSTVEVRGLSLNEVGLSIAHQVQRGGGSFAVGVTPKIVMAKVVDYVADVNNADKGDINASENIKTHNNVNLDFGIARDYGNGWRTGLVVKNAIKQDYETVRGNIVKLNPQARFGIAHQNGWSTVALDVDLTKNEPVDFEEKSQFVSVGAEFNALDWAQVRVGYRADLVTQNRNVASVGLGLSPFGVHLDLAVAGSQDEIGASAQLGFRF